MLKLTLIACGNKMPSWVEMAVNEYAKRLKEFIHLSLIEIPLCKRSKSSDLTRILEKESSLMIAAIPAGARVIGLDIGGESFSSEALAAKFEKLQQTSSHLCILIGGPEGFSARTRAHFNESWSLSALTLPHPLVRILLVEAIYRACSIIANHPYHK